MNFKKLIKGEKVLLLGPAPHILEPNSTKDWGDFDVIVKVNKMVEKGGFIDEKLNNRTDILYHCMHIDNGNGDEPYCVKTWKEKGVKHVRMPISGASMLFVMNNIRFIQINKRYNLDFSVSPVSVYDELCRNCGNTAPNTGIAAINDLLLNGPNILDIRGFTFMKSGYMEGYKNKRWVENKKRREKSTSHRPEKQIEFFKKLLSDNKNIKIDKELQEAINE